MFYNNILLSIIIFIAIPFRVTQNTVAKPATLVQWVVEKNSSIQIEGRSNVNSFTCNVNEYAQKDTINCITGPYMKIDLSGEIQMDILSFDCHSGLITKNLRKTLKAKEYPTVTIRFISLQVMPLFKSTHEVIKGWVEVELAGTIKRFELDYSFSRDLSGYIQLNGGRNFRFSDFKLLPPKKLGGLVKVKDDFNVNFQLVLRTV